MLKTVVLLNISLLIYVSRIRSKEQHLFSLYKGVFTIAFDQFNALYKSINFFFLNLTFLW